MESLDEYRSIKMEDTFHFSCTGCGKCCHGRHKDIILTGYDFFLLRKTLGISSKELATQYCDAHVGTTSKFPFFSLAMKYDGSCKFLSSEGKCLVHDGKPASCALFPIGRSFSWTLKTSEQIVEYKLTGNTRNCKGDKVPVKLSDWLKQYNISPGAEEVISYTEGIVDLRNTDFIKKYSANYDKLDTKAMIPVLNVLCRCFFDDYDTAGDYISQLLRNVKYTKELFSDPALMDMLNIAPVPERNSPCPCGSGKKYKKCCMETKL
jgi:Fe-S-cluster containining protein